MSATWYVKADPQIGLSIDTPEMPRPVGEPDYGPVQLGCQATSWIDEIFDVFVRVIDANPSLEVYVEVGNDPDDWGIMQAWIVRPVAQPRPQHSSHS
jgi:hypothetical protein